MSNDSHARLIARKNRSMPSCLRGGRYGQSPAPAVRDAHHVDECPGGLLERHPERERTRRRFVQHVLRIGDYGGGVAHLLGYPSGVPVRDSKNPHGPALVFQGAAWSSFVAAVRDEEFGNRD
ncbi:DUF397 domain-containing protein [Streptomyces inhibens]|uniref:DUF397 domain-containing protein n=1 Tax=Streptomyces inhibens TaxID=2293571 RepID=UPI00402AA407